MKPGSLTLDQFVSEIERRHASQIDIVAPANRLTVDDSSKLAIQTRPEQFGMNRTFQQQVASHLGYPLQFWDKTQAEHPEQWAGLVNAMLQSNNERRMVRTLDGNGRAFLSNRYLRIDNMAVANAIARAVKGRNGWQIESADVTDDKMFIKIMTDKVREPVKGQPVQAGFIIGNSETGQGSYYVQFLVMELICTNGLILDKLGLRRMHLGAQIGGDSAEVMQLYSRKTTNLIEASILSATQDVIRNVMTGSRFDEVVRQFQALKKQDITAPVQDVVELAAQDYGMSEGEQKSIFRQMVEAQNGANHLSLVQAITYTAQQAETYSRAVELEEIGGKVFDLTPKGWQRLNEVKPAKKLNRKEKAA